MKNKKIVLSISVCLIIGLLSFWGGTVFSNSKKPVNQFANRQGDFSQNSGGKINQGVRGGMGGELISGEVLSIDTESITLKLRDGGSKIIFFSPTTKIEKTTEGIASDVVIGKTIMINGTSNSDGSVSAALIQFKY